MVDSRYTTPTQSNRNNSQQPHLVQSISIDSDNSLLDNTMSTSTNKHLQFFPPPPPPPYTAHHLQMIKKRKKKHTQQHQVYSRGSRDPSSVSVSSCSTTSDNDYTSFVRNATFSYEEEEEVGDQSTDNNTNYFNMEKASKLIRSASTVSDKWKMKKKQLAKAKFGSDSKKKDGTTADETPVMSNNRKQLDVASQRNAPLATNSSTNLFVQMDDYEVGNDSPDRVSVTTYSTDISSNPSSNPNSPGKGRALGGLKFHPHNSLSFEGGMVEDEKVPPKTPKKTKSNLHKKGKSSPKSVMDTLESSGPPRTPPRNSGSAFDTSTFDDTATDNFDESTAMYESLAGGSVHQSPLRGIPSPIAAPLNKVHDMIHDKIHDFFSGNLCLSSNDDGTVKPTIMEHLSKRCDAMDEEFDYISDGGSSYDEDSTSYDASYYTSDEEEDDSRRYRKKKLIAKKNKKYSNRQSSNKKPPMHNEKRKGKSAPPPPPAPRIIPTRGRSLTAKPGYNSDGESLSRASSRSVRSVETPSSGPDKSELGKALKHLAKEDEDRNNAGGGKMDKSVTESVLTNDQAAWMAMIQQNDTIPQAENKDSENSILSNGREEEESPTEEPKELNAVEGYFKVCPVWVSLFYVPGLDYVHMFLIFLSHHLPISSRNFLLLVFNFS